MRSEQRAHRVLAAAAATLTAVALLVLPPVRAGAVGDGNPVITAPGPTSKLYAGFTGPFVTSFELAPQDVEYEYWAEKIPSGGGVPVVVGVKQQVTPGAIAEWHLTVPALAAGSYTFHVTDDGDPVEHSTSLAFTVLPGPPPTCSVLLPAQVRMKARSALVTARLSPMCTTLRTEYASWQVKDPKGFFAANLVFADSARSARWRIYDDEWTGSFVARPENAHDLDDTKVPQNTARLAMKMDGRTRFTSSRSGRTVTLRVTTSRYSPSKNRYVVWTRRKVVVAARSCSTCPWKRVGVRTTDRRGTAMLKVRSAKVRQYRVTAAGTTTVWAPLPRYTRR